MVVSTMKFSEQNIAPDLSRSSLFGIGGFLGAILGASLGALCGFVLPEPYYRLTNPQILSDGQWGLIYLKVIPEGLLIGSVIGLIVGLVVSNKMNR